MGTAGLCMLMLTGCGGQNKKTYDQAVTDLSREVMTMRWKVTSLRSLPDIKVQSRIVGQV